MADTGAHEDPRWGKRHLNIEGYYRTFQPRVAPDGEFGNADRKWRAQWLKDQKLVGADKHSPFGSSGLNQYQLEQIPEFRKARWNIFRRTLRMPMDLIERAVINTTGMHWTKARFGRNAFSYGWKGALFFYTFAYHMMYRANDWEDRRNWKIRYEKPESVPSHSDFPHQNAFKREKADYNDQNFQKSALFAANVDASTKVHN
jgi:hypothetical protein